MLKLLIRYILVSLRKEYASENGTELNTILPKMSPLNPKYLEKKQTLFKKIPHFPCAIESFATLHSILYKEGQMDPDRLIGLKFKVLHTLMEKEVHKILQQYKITPAQGDILRFLEANKGRPVNQRDIERHLSLSNPTVTGTIKRLETKGLISASPNALDKRSKDIALTRRAEEHKLAVDRAILGMEQKALGGLTGDQVQTLHGLLTKITNNLKGS